MDVQRSSLRTPGTGTALNAPTLIGSGTSADPYLVESAEDFLQLGLDLTAHYVLTENIDLSSIPNYIPIGYGIDMSCTVKAMQCSDISKTSKDLCLSSGGTWGAQQSAEVADCSAACETLFPDINVGYGSRDAYTAGENVCEWTDQNPKAFSGSLDGQDFSITGLTANHPYHSGVGLFAYIKNAMIQNLKVSVVSITSFSGAGGLAAYADGAVVTNVEISGESISASHYYGVGGVIGRVTGLEPDSEINYSIFSDVISSVNTVSGKDAVGGAFGSIDRSVNASEISVSGATVTGSGSYIGGVVGKATNNGTLSKLAGDSLTVSGNTAVGSLVGLAGWYTIVKNSSSIASSVTGATKIGGAIGELATSSTLVSISVKDVQIEVSDKIAGGLVGSSAWGNTIRNSSVGAGEGSVPSITYTGSETSPFTARFGGLAGEAFGTLVSSCNTESNINGGNYAKEVGGLVGYLFEVSRVRVNTTAKGTLIGYQDVGGLIGLIESTDGTAVYIEDVSSDTDITASIGVGGIVGRAFINNSNTMDLKMSFRNVTSAGSITANNNAENIGGICGSCIDAVIKDALNKGAISASTASANGGRIGGVVGYGEKLDVIRVTNTGNITFNGSTDSDNHFGFGGIAGELKTSSSIDESFSSGTITVTQGYALGGVAGVLENADVTDSYNAGNLTLNHDAAAGKKFEFGGFVGKLYGSINLHNGYTKGSLTHNQASQAEGFIGDEDTGVTISFSGNSYCENTETNTNVTDGLTDWSTTTLTSDPWTYDVTGMRPVLINNAETF